MGERRVQRGVDDRGCFWKEGGGSKVRGSVGELTRVCGFEKDLLLIPVYWVDGWEQGRRLDE